MGKGVEQSRECCCVSKNGGVGWGSHEKQWGGRKPEKKTRRTKTEAARGKGEHPIGKVRPEWGGLKKTARDQGGRWPSAALKKNPQSRETKGEKFRDCWGMYRNSEKRKKKTVNRSGGRGWPIGNKELE